MLRARNRRYGIEYEYEHEHEKQPEQSHAPMCRLAALNFRNHSGGHLMMVAVRFSRVSARHASAV